MNSPRHNQSSRELFDLFVARTRALNGAIIQEREQWNTEVTADAIRHFCDGVGDDNPRWLMGSRHTAPPAFLASVLYPIIHGAPMELPLVNLILDLEYRWYQPVAEGDRLEAVVRQKDAFERKHGDGTRSICIIGETEYRNQCGEQIAEAESTMMRLSRNNSGDNAIKLVDRTIHEYTPGELEEIGEALRRESDARTAMDQVRFGDEVEVGTELPELVRGPLTIGDMICWQAAIGPSYRAGPSGYRDALAAPHTLVRNPVTGWSVKNSQEHEDFLLASHRGMPAPFDNGLMRFASLVPLLTNWMGKRGFLRRLSVQILTPNLYGDTTWYRGTITKKTEGVENGSNEGFVLHVAITGTNQLGETSTTGEAEVFLPSKSLSRASAATARRNLQPDDKIEDRYLYELVEQRLLVNPGKTALISGGREISGEMLQHRIDDLASRLRMCGVGSEIIVGICLDRSSPDLVAGLAAILKVGGAYLPLEPELPKERLNELLEDAALRVVVTQKHHLSKFAGGDRLDESVQMICVDEEDGGAETINAGPHCLVEVFSLTDDHPAYLLYTSGITAQPKRVLVPHTSLSVYIQSLARALPVTSRDIYLQSALLSFSAASRQVWLPLYIGATLVVATREQATDPVDLFTLIKERGVTVWDTVPSIWNMVIRALERLDSKTRTELLDNDLRLILVTGEPLSWATVHAWRETLGHDGAEIINLYSQTETAGTVCCYPVPTSAKQDGVVPLGRPIDNTEVYVLDNELCPVAEGDAGEICVAGARLAREYHGQAALTAERFVIPSDGELAGIRLYRTRDRGRRRSDGVLEHLGRLDEQLKIRGHRVAPAEVERAIMANAQVKEAAVGAVEGRSGERNLVAWVVPIESRLQPIPELDEPFLTEISLRQTLASKLPAYMVPSRFFFLEELPRTPAGKIDRLALVAGALTRSEGHVEQTKGDLTGKGPEDQGPLENELANIWCELLEVERVGLDDDFFELGGDSLKAGELLATVRGMYDVPVPLRDFFRQPTITGLREIIENNGNHRLASRAAQDNLGEKLRKLDGGFKGEE